MSVGSGTVDYFTISQSTLYVGGVETQSTRTEAKNRDGKTEAIHDQAHRRQQWFARVKNKARRFLGTADEHLKRPIASVVGLVGVPSASSCAEG